MSTTIATAILDQAAVSIPIPTPVVCTTRSQYKKRILSLMNHNEELEKNLLELQRSNQRYQIKTNVQDILIKELIDTIHNNNANVNDDDISTSTKNKKKKKNMDKVSNKSGLVSLLTRNAHRIIELSMENEKMKLQQQQQRKKHDHCHEEEDDNDDNESITVSTSSLSSYSSSSVSFEDKQARQHNKCEIQLQSELQLQLRQTEEQCNYYKKKCDSLERSVNTFKSKNSHREIKNSISLRNMKHQIEILEMERKRRFYVDADVDVNFDDAKEMKDQNRKYITFYGNHQQEQTQERQTKEREENNIERRRIVKKDNSNEEDEDNDRDEQRRNKNIDDNEITIPFLSL